MNEISFPEIYFQRLKGLIVINYSPSESKEEKPEVTICRFIITCSVICMITIVAI